MTVAIESCVVDYVGNGSTLDFPTTFKFTSSDQLLVQTAPIGVDTFTTAEESVDYEVVGAGDEEGGVVSFNSAPDVGTTIRIERAVEMLQLTAFRDQGSFSPALHENAFDYLTFIVQQMAQRIDDLEADSVPLATPTWIAPTLAAAFANFGSGEATAGYHKDRLGYVHMKGNVVTAAGASAGATVFTLPAGYRPSEVVRFATRRGGDLQLISVDAAGVVKIEIALGAAGTTSLDCYFLAEQ